LDFGPHKDDLQRLVFGDLKDAKVLGMGPDVWELSQTVVPYISAEGRFIGVHTDGKAIEDARRRSGNGNGHHNPNVEFHCVDNDLRMSCLAADNLVQELSPKTLTAFRVVEQELARLRTEQPLVADESVDLVFATGLQHLASPAVRSQMLKDFHRVVKRGGRLVVVDVVSDESISTSDLLKADDQQRDELGVTVLRDLDLLGSLAEAGFYGVTVVRRDTLPWKTIGRTELRRCAVVGYKGKEGPCWEHYQAVMYRGPFKNVEDDDGHFYPRGQQIAVCQKTFNILSQEPYRGQFEYTDPLFPIPEQMRKPFPCNLTNPIRDPQYLKFRPPALSQAASAHQAVPQNNSPTTAPKNKNGDGKSSKKVVIFERSSAGDSSLSSELLRNLQEQTSEELDVQIVNLAEDNVEVTLPAQLRFRMSLAGEDCLPALVVNGVLVAIGTLPDKEEAAKLVARGKPFGPLPITNLKSLAAQANECCSGSGCC
jgi:hypothetical protein